MGCSFASSSSDPMGSCCQEAGRSFPGALGLIQEPAQLAPTAQNSGGKIHVHLSRSCVKPGEKTRALELVRSEQWELQGCGGMERMELLILVGAVSLRGSRSLGGNSLFLVCPGAFEHLHFEIFAK